MRNHNREAADSGIITWDCKYEEEVMVIPYDHFYGGDNPMQAEECSHGGLKCNYFCRTCRVGGTNAEKRTDKGYTDLFKVSNIIYCKCYSDIYLVWRITDTRRNTG